jgi:hypothetical protein
MSGDRLNSINAGAQTDLPELDPKTHEIFVKYSRLPPDTVQAHVLKNVSLRQEALRHGSL